jgi:hypothetical protein
MKKNKMFFFFIQKLKFKKSLCRFVESGLLYAHNTKFIIFFDYYAPFFSKNRFPIIRFGVSSYQSMRDTKKRLSLP